jgi:hypothetical protein
MGVKGWGVCRGWGFKGVGSREWGQGSGVKGWGVNWVCTRDCVCARDGWGSREGGQGMGVKGFGVCKYVEGVGRARGGGQGREGTEHASSLQRNVVEAPAEARPAHPHPHTCTPK